MSEYFGFLGRTEISKRGQTIFDFLGQLLVEPTPQDEHFCLDSLNSLFLQNFENLRAQGRLLEFKQDYLE